MFLIVLVLSVSGVVLYVAPPGRYANFNGWQVLGVDKSGWEAIHTNFSWLFLIVVSLHVYFNWRVIRGYLKRGVAWTIKYRLELGSATVVSIAALVGTLMWWPPFGTVMDFGEAVKRHWEVEGITRVGNPWAVALVVAVFLAVWGAFSVLSKQKGR